MKNHHSIKVVAVALAVLMFASVFSITASAWTVNYNTEVGSSYYNLISQREWNIAPGIDETEIVLNNASGTRRQVLHTATVDLNNPFTKVIPGYKDMNPTVGHFGTEATSVQALNAEKLGYGNVVVATNAMLSWYTEQWYKDHPEYIGEPLGWNICNGQYYENSRGSLGGMNKEYAALVINYDNHPVTGEKRPDDMPKVQMRSIADPLTGWEENAISVWRWLVKPNAQGVPTKQYNGENHSGGAARTFIGIKADGTLIMTVNDGEMAPFSTGFTEDEMADYMLKMGCVYAANCDGGGSTTFCSQRPGEDLKVNGGMADGGERPTTNTILVISTAPADGEFARASLSTEYEYYTPGSSVQVNALGSDAVGTKVDVPDDVEWTLKEENMGTIDNKGVFTSNGTEGTATIQLKYNGKVVGEHIINIVIPDTISFDQPLITVPFGKTVNIPVKATIQNGLIEIGISPSSMSYTTTNDALGSFDGLNFTAVDEADAPADLSSSVTATLNMGTNPTATVNMKLGKGSEVLWDFEDGQADVDEWNVINNRKGTVWDYDMALSLADKENGQVHDGNYSLRLETNGLHSKASNASEYAYIRLGVDGDAVQLENARTLGFWMYVPEDNIQCDVRMDYKFDADGDGTLEGFNQEVKLLPMETCYHNFDESGWHYLTVDLSEYKKVALQNSKTFPKTEGGYGEFFLMIVFNRTKNNALWQTNGSINGPFTYYFDNFTVDYSEAVDDREEPVFEKMYLDGTTPLVRYDAGEPVVTNNNVLNVSAAVADATTRPDMTSNGTNTFPLHNISGINADSAKAYVDGVEVNASFANGTLSVNGVKVADGYHRIKFEICDNAGNKAVMIRVVKVESGSEDSTLKLVPADATLDRIPFGSIYWMNLEANKIETIKSVSAEIDLNNVNHWQLDHMILADGFTAEYTTTSETETNTATITITRTGENDQTGNAVLAQIPVRILNFDDDIKVPGYTAQTYWTKYDFYPQDMKMDVDKGLITHVDGSTSTFSNEQFHVDTEMYRDLSSIDKVYLSEHGTTHVHNAAAIEDKAPTCTQPGYTGRTFCEDCNSVVDWGTTIPATGHKWVFRDGKKVCDVCGKEATVENGLQVIDGKYYYYAGGKPVGGWVSIDDEWYYFDETTFTTVPTFNNGYVTYEFEENGKLKSGQWYRDSVGIKYFEGPSYLRGGKNVFKWFTIDGKDYCINKQGYVATGTRWVNDDDNDPFEKFTWYVFDENGACQGRYNYTGIARWNGNVYYVKDGLSQTRMQYVDGKYYFFYWTNQRAGIKDQRFHCNYNNGLLPNGDYYFGSDGAMLDNEVYSVDGTLYYFVLGKESQGTGSVVYNGVECQIEANGKVLYSGLTKDADGVVHKYENGVEVQITKEGIFEENGNLYYYENGAKVQKGLVRDENGDYYYFGLKYYAVKNGAFYFPADKMNGLYPEGGSFVVGADGKVVIPEPKNGIVKEGDNLFYYENGVKVAKGLVKDANGDFYYFGLNCKAVKNGVFYFPDDKMNGYLPKGGTFNVDADGKVIITEPKNGIVEEGGNLYYYENDVKVAKGLVKAENGDFYYFGLSYKAVRNGVFYFPDDKMNGYLPKGGTFNVDADGKVIITEPKNGIVEEGGNLYYYENDVKVAKGLVKDANGDFYYFGLSYKAVKNGAFYFPDEKMNGYFPKGGTFNVDADGKVIITEPKNGIVEEGGNLYYYENDVKVAKGLVKDENGDFYYFGLKYYAVKDGAYYFPDEKMNGYFPHGGTFSVDADGKVQIP